jgi:hypothetical protein
MEKNEKNEKKENENFCCICFSKNVKAKCNDCLNLYCKDHMKEFLLDCLFCKDVNT